MATNAERQSAYKARNADAWRLDVLLPAESLTDLEAIRAHLNAKTDREHSRRDALMYVLSYARASMRA